MDKDTRKLLKAAEAQGFTWRLNASGHAMVYKNGGYVATFGGTISDVRGYRNNLAKLRRAGLVWPPKR